MRLLLVGNPASGSGRGRARTLEAETELKAGGARVITVLTERVGHARELLAKPPADVERVVACGGDGLIAECAAALRGGEVALAVIPAGRGNDLAHALGVPGEIRAAARAALGGRVARIDLGVANGRPFCTVAACGIDAEVSRRARTSPLPLPGAGVYVIELLRALRTFAGARCVAQVDGDRIDERLVVLAVANCPTYGGGFRIAPQASVQDGLLDVCAVRYTSRLRALSLFPTVFRGRHLALPEVTTMRCASLRLECEPPQVVEADGELLAATPVDYRCEPATLPVVMH